SLGRWRLRPACCCCCKSSVSGESSQVDCASLCAGDGLYFEQNGGCVSLRCGSPPFFIAAGGARMSIRKIGCPACGVTLRVADTLPVGKAIKCPRCREGFPIPEDEPPRRPEPVDEEEPDEEPERRPAPRKRRRRPKPAASNAPLILGG